MVHLRGAFRKIGATNPCKEQCLHLHIVGKTEVFRPTCVCPCVCTCVCTSARGTCRVHVRRSTRFSACSRRPGNNGWRHDVQEEMKAAEAAVRSKMGDEPLPAYVYSEMVRLGCEVPYGFDAVRSLLHVSCAALSPPCYRPECQLWCRGAPACPRHGARPACCPPSASADVPPASRVPFPPTARTYSEICGPDQSYLSHIMKETNAKLLVVGRGALQHQDVADGLVVYVGSSDLQHVQDAVRPPLPPPLPS